VPSPSCYPAGWSSCSGAPAQELRKSTARWLWYLNIVQQLLTMRYSLVAVVLRIVNMSSFVKVWRKGAQVWDFWSLGF
jgi:hypothetical protein